MTFYGIGSFFDGFKTAVSGPEVPFFQKGLRIQGSLIPELLKVEPNMISPDSFQIELFDVQLFKNGGLIRFEVSWIL